MKPTGKRGIKNLFSIIMKKTIVFKYIIMNKKI